MSHHKYKITDSTIVYKKVYDKPTFRIIDIMEHF
jgi:hypothetical protein